MNSRGRARNGSDFDEETTDAADYAALSFDYADGVLASMTVRGAGASDPSSKNALGMYIYDFSGANDVEAWGANAWRYHVVVTLPGGAGHETYFNFAGQPMLDGRFDETHSQYIVHRYDNIGRETLMGSNSAIDDIDDGNLGVVDLEAGAGVIYGTSYNSNGYVEEETIRHGTGGSAIKVASYTYVDREFNGVTIQLPEDSTVYRSDAGGGSGPVTTHRKYEDDQFRQFLPILLRTNLPGGGGIEQIFDAFGRVVSETDEDGFATAYEYDDDTGALKKTIVSTGTQTLTTSVSGGDRGGGLAGGDSRADVVCVRH